MRERQHNRVELDTESTVSFPDNKEFVCRTMDVSLGGMKLSHDNLRELFHYIGKKCLVEFLVDIKEDIETKQVFIQAEAKIANGFPDGVGLAFVGLDADTLPILEKLVTTSLNAADLKALESKKGVRVKSDFTKILKNELGAHIVESVKEIFIAFLNMDVVVGPYVERSDFEEYTPPDTEVTAVILFRGGLTGGIHVASPLHTAIQAAGAMLGEEGLEFKKEQEDMVWDAIGEIANQVAGGIQTRVSDSCDNIDLTPPNVVVGPNFKINYNTNLTSVRQFFKSNAGPFYIECFFT
ncbi:MAG: chemotaxis protein CheX [Magnetococcales bacterium]|nr:chemotaxis protein CheX [Magnetococcales bacterium]